MSDENREDTLVDEASEADTLGSVTQTEDGASEDSLIFGKYKDLEAAEKGQKELEQKLHALATEKAQLEQQAQVATALEKLADAQVSASQKPDDSAERYKAFLAEVAEDFREQPEVGVEKFAQVTNSWIADVEKKFEERYEKEMSELKQTIGGLNEKMGDMNPDYQAHKELVDKMVSDGMPKAKAIEWAKQMEPKESRVLPTSMNGTVKRGGDQKGAYLTKEEREALKKSEGLSDEDLDLMEAEAQARFARGGKLI